MIKLLIISCAVLCSSCSVVPVVKSPTPQDIECGVVTHEYDLKLVEMGGMSASCNSPECLLSLGLMAAAWTGFTAIISGSIVVVGNTVHWLEQLGPCNNGHLDQKIDDINQPLIQQGGKPIRTKAELEQEIEDQ